MPLGIYQLAPTGEASWHGIACEIFRQATALGVDLAIALDNVAAIPTADYLAPAQRILNSRLTLGKL